MLPLELLAIKKFQNARWRQQLKKVMARRGFCWQRVMAGRRIFPNRVKVAYVMADDYGKKACHKKVMTTLSLCLSLSLSLSFSLSLSISTSLSISCFLISVSLSYNSASVLPRSKEHSAEKIVPKAGIEPLSFT
jgi:hypothetical protein